MHTLFALGSNGSGQLGLGHTEDVAIPTPVPFQDPVQVFQIQRIAAGGNHTLILFSNGAVYAAGDNSRGQCMLEYRDGVHNNDQPHIFRKAGYPSEQLVELKFKLCSATWEASTCVMQTGRLFVAGKGLRGELGLGEDIKEAPEPCIIPDFPPPGTDVVDIAGCMMHTVAVLSNGEVYGWGSGRKGQLGEPRSDCWKPRKIKGIPFKAVRAICGREFTFIISSAIEGKHIVLGSDKWAVMSSAPVTTIHGWKDIGASWGTIHVLLETGKLLSWGRNDRKQIPSHTPIVERIAIGSEHGLGLTESGQVAAWGWGEHGNCGEVEKDNSETHNQSWKEFRLPGKIQALGAGCATSWVYCDE